MNDRLCPECHEGQLVKRPSGFSACQKCGKLVVAPVPDPTPDPVESEPTTPADPWDGPIAIPDFSEVMVGWRAWGVDPDTPAGTPPLLQSVTYGHHIWQPREAIEATCARHNSSGVKYADHEVPVEDCTCGLYSAKTYEHLQSMRYHEYDADKRGLYHVVGSVSLWGKVIEGSQGWRAQFGYPRELFVPFEAWRLAKPLADAYGVPVQLKNILSSNAAESEE